MDETSYEQQTPRRRTVRRQYDPVRLGILTAFLLVIVGGGVYFFTRSDSEDEAVRSGGGETFSIQTILHDDTPAHKRTERTVADGSDTADAVTTARTWVETRSSTYTFDGQYLKLVEVTEDAPKGCSGCFEVVFSYQTRHPGLGDRAGTRQAEIGVVTEHAMVVVVRDGAIIQALSDSTYDEYAHALSDEQVVQREQEEEAEPGEEEEVEELSNELPEPEMVSEAEEGENNNEDL